MFRLSYFIVIYAIFGVSDGISVLRLSEYDVIHVVNYHNTCSREDAEHWANVFVNCFMDSQYKSTRDLFNIVAKLLDHSKRCIKFATLECRPNYDGFLNIMGSVIDMIKEFSIMHVERLTDAGVITYAERNKIKDFNCVENSLTKDTYATCFSSLISASEQVGNNETYDLVYQREVETAILCTNIVKRQCSKSVQVDLNKVVRYILGIKQPEKENIGNDRMTFQLPRTTDPPEPSEFSEFKKDNINDNYKTPIFSHLSSQLSSTDFLAKEKEKNKNITENKEPLESRDFLRQKNNDEEFLNPIKSLQSTEPSIFAKQTTTSNKEISEGANIKINPKIPEYTNSTILLKNSKTTEYTKTNGSSNSSTFLSTAKVDNILQITETIEPMKMTEFTNLEDLSNSTNFDNLKDSIVESGKDLEIDHFLQDTVAEFMRTEFEDKFTESTETTIDFEEKSTAFTIISKFNEHPKSIEATETLIATEHQKTNTTKSFIKAAEFPKTTTSEHSTTTMFSKFSKPVAHSKSSMSPEDNFHHHSIQDSEEEFMTREFEEETRKRAEETTENSMKSTVLPKTTTTEHSTTTKFSNLSKFTEHSRTSLSRNVNFHNHAEQDTEEEFMTTEFEEESAESFETTTDFEEEFTEFTMISKLTEHPKSAEATKPQRAVDNPLNTTQTKFFISTEHPAITTTENSMKSTNLPKSTTTERLTTTKSSKLVKPTTHSAAVTARTFPRPTQAPKSTERSSAIMSTKSSNPTHHTTSSTSRKPPKIRERQRTTTTRRPRMSSSSVRSRSRYEDDTPRPTEAPKPWYDFIVRPFVSLWRTVKSWFGW